MDRETRKFRNVMKCMNSGKPAGIYSYNIGYYWYLEAPKAILLSAPSISSIYFFGYP
jgi:hypothetical protein